MLENDEVVLPRYTLPPSLAPFLTSNSSRSPWLPPFVPATARRFPLIAIA